ncbi:ubiquitin specific protease 5 [Lycorma delicatula]|uniref:ubiquitin specific protease 5 n=1 Tax=Lycorma delicatula TaxID=130591 RepID=UPI003F512276
MADKLFECLSSQLPRIRIPTDNDKIYKDECVYSFDSPETETGLYICLNTFFGLGRDHVERHFQKTGNAVYLHIRRERIDISNKMPGDGPEKKVTRLAIGVEGGFDADIDKKKFEIKETMSIVILPDFLTCPWPSTDLPDKLISVVRGVLLAESASKIAEKEALTGTWDGEVRIVTKHADSLLQLDNGKKIPPNGWKCEKCDLDNNLWLNLTDGSILCGRQFFDGSGGNDHAVKHYSATGYPLAVKLGTITKEGKADVFSYDEDDMVEDPNLAKHLAHFGINVTQMEKTDKSMVELELDLNQRVGEWAALQENASQLKPIYGPGYTGMVNLGNSCYLNSIMQVVFTIPHFIRRFVEEAPAIFDSNNNDPANDFNTQMAKLGTGLLSGKYSRKPPEGSEDVYPKGISPLMFKTLIGKGHADFSTKRQQDAQEFFLHFITILQRNSRHIQDPSDAFKFQVEDRFECSGSHKVKYTYRTEYCLPLPIPLEAAINKNEVANWEAKKAEAEAKGQRVDLNLVVRPRIKLFSCLEVFSQVENVEQFYSTALNAKTTAHKTTRLASFPDYLMLHLKKFTLREDWVPVKLDVSVEMPDMIDLASLRAGGPQPGEENLPELQGSPPPLHLDSNILSTLVDMGFPVEAAKKAVYFTESSGIEQATNWVMEHIGDSDFLEPFVPPGVGKLNTASDQAPFIPNEGAVFMLTGMGFTRAQAEKALKATDNNVERAADWIFSHASELDDQAEEVNNPQSNNQTSVPVFCDGSSRYKLVAFISHMGTSTMVGHYVCHILKDNQWIIFNDEKVSLSENPPKDLGYLYLYEREKV